MTDVGLQRKMQASLTNMASLRKELCPVLSLMRGKDSVVAQYQLCSQHAFVARLVCWPSLELRGMLKSACCAALFYITTPLLLSCSSSALHSVLPPYLLFSCSPSGCLALLCFHKSFISISAATRRAASWDIGADSFKILERFTASFLQPHWPLACLATAALICRRAAADGAACSK